MYDINLINKQKTRGIVVQSSDISKIMVLSQVLILLFLISAAGVFAGLHFMTKSSNKKIVYFQSEMTKYTEVTKVKQNIKMYNDKIKNITEIIHSTSGKAIINTKLLRDIAAVMPDDTFLTNYTVENNGEVKVTGKSKINDNVAYFSQKLKETSLFNDVIVKSIVYSPNDNVYDFDISIKTKN